ncbi:MAG: serine/threonine protein phosphatase [Hyphomicrobiaceae bacterium]|nr:serine/threonine protein phosphatase [Hyphomicrobiaceae bacterium]
MSKAANIPPNTRIYAIGDIHGCADHLETLLDQITKNDRLLDKVKNKKLVFLGDYIDRGPASKKVLDTLLHDLPKDYEAIFLKGNHELMLIEALENSQAAEFWLRNGGRETISSYNVELTTHRKPNASAKLIKAFKKRLPAQHLKFFKELQLSFQFGDYFFVHAGIHPDRPLDKQQEQDMLWIRDRFLFSEKNFGKIIIHGHTPSKDVDEADNQIGIDTAAVYGGCLTALMLENGKRQYLHSKSRPKKT